MTKLILTLSLLFIYESYYAQIKKFEFGEITDQEKQLKDCSFEKNAAAVVLFNIGRTFCYAGLNIINTGFEKHKRIKILNSKGFDIANVKIYIPDRKKNGELKKLKAQTYNFDSNGNIEITKVESSLIYKKQFNKYTTEISFTFPKVNIGSILEYSFTIDNPSVEVENWYFQEKIPTLYSGYEIEFPKEIMLQSVPSGPLEVTSKIVEKGTKTLNTHEIENAFSVNKEPYMTSVKDYTTSVAPIITFFDANSYGRIELKNNWVKIIDDLMEDSDFGAQLKKNIPRTKDLEDSLQSKKTDFEKMKTIYYYVQKNMQWNDVNSIWAMSGVKNAWEEKKGTLGEINFILANLLREVKLDAKPILLSSLDNGFVKPAIPSIMQFNKVMVYVTIDKEYYVLDATDKNTPIELIPASVNFTEGILINKLKKGGWGWITLSKPNYNYKQCVNTQAAIEGGSLNGKVTIVSNEYAKVERVTHYRENPSSYEKQFYTPNDGLEIKKKTIVNVNTELTPLIEELDISLKLNNTGEYSYFTLNALSGLDKNPFTNPERISDIFYGYNHNIKLTGQITLDENYVFEELPKNKTFLSPDSSMRLSRMVQQEENMLQYVIFIDFTKPFYPADEYEIFFQIQKLIYQILEEQIVIKKIKK